MPAFVLALLQDVDRKDAVDDGPGWPVILGIPKPMATAGRRELASAVYCRWLRHANAPERGAGR